MLFFTICNCVSCDLWPATFYQHELLAPDASDVVCQVLGRLWFSQSVGIVTCGSRWPQDRHLALRLSVSSCSLTTHWHFCSPHHQSLKYDCICDVRLCPSWRRWKWRPLHQWAARLTLWLHDQHLQEGRLHHLQSFILLLLHPQPGNYHSMTNQAAPPLQNPEPQLAPPYFWSWQSPDWRWWVVLCFPEWRGVHLQV